MKPLSLGEGVRSSEAGSRRERETGGSSGQAQGGEKPLRVWGRIASAEIKITDFLLPKFPEWRLRHLFFQMFAFFFFLIFSDEVKEKHPPCPHVRRACLTSSRNLQILDDFAFFVLLLLLLVAAGRLDQVH